MNQIKWCLKVKNGIELIEPNKNLSDVYLKKAENALKATIKLKGNNEWEISSCYYSMYFALYSIMMKIGIKCENHKCTIEFMQEFLNSKFDSDEIRLLRTSMKARVDTQYYDDRRVPDKFHKLMITKAPLFIVKCKEIMRVLKQNEIQDIRERLRRIKK